MLTSHTDLLSLPDKDIRGALRHIWCNYTYTSMDTPWMAYKAISEANAKRMIETSQEHRRESREARQLHGGCSMQIEKAPEGG